MKLADLKANLRRKKIKEWFVYLIECRDGSYYCGITNNLERRINEHNTGKGAKYTRGRTPVKLLVSVTTSSRSSALILEASVKKKRKKEKVSFLLSHEAS